jgi:hypothetical protein
MASRPAITQSGSRFATIRRNSPTAFQRNGNLTQRSRNFSRGSGNFSRWNGNWRHRGHRDRDRVIFISSFGFPWYPYYYGYGYYPYGSYPYGYGYPYYGAYNGDIYQGDAAYNYGNNGTYSDDRAYYGERRDGRGSSTNSSVVAQVQRSLAQEGYYKGAIDGDMGPRTHYAIRAYQRAHNLPVDGTINDRLLAGMGLR